MSIFPEKENLCSKIQYVKINTQSIVNCIEIIDNELILTQVQNDINHFIRYFEDNISKISNLIKRANMADLEKSDIFSSVKNGSVSSSLSIPKKQKQFDYPLTKNPSAIIIQPKLCYK